MRMSTQRMSKKPLRCHALTPPGTLFPQHSRHVGTGTCQRECTRPLLRENLVHAEQDNRGRVASPGSASQDEQESQGRDWTSRQAALVLACRTRACNAEMMRDTPSILNPPRAASKSDMHPPHARV